MQRFSALAGGVALALLMVPSLARTTEEFIRLVPAALREASLALGVPAWKTSLRVVLRTALGGIVTARPARRRARRRRDRAAALHRAQQPVLEHRPVQPTASLTVQIFNYAISPYDDWHQKAWAAALVLLLLVGAPEPHRAVPLPEPAAGCTPMNAAQEIAPVNSTLRRSVDAAETEVPTSSDGSWPCPGVPKLTVENLNAWYGKNHALHDVSLPVPPRSVTAVIGPSGCGKSTFLRCLNRMHELIPGARAEGTLLIDGEGHLRARRRPGEPAAARGHGLPAPEPVPHHVDPRQRGRRACKLNGIPGNHAEIVERTLRQAALWDEVKDRLDASALSLSGGQQQRLCIARALAVEPEVLLMDEPASALDPIATAKIEELIHELKARYTIVIVTHNMQQAARVSDHTAFFYMGDLIEVGPTEKIFTNPSEKRTEDYVTGKFG